MSNPTRAAVRHTPLRGKPAQCLATLATMCSAGAQCTQVQSSPVALQALAVLKAAVTTAQASLTNKLNLVAALVAAMKANNIDLLALGPAVRSYEAAVGVLADGDASIITKAGCLSRDAKTPASALEKVSVVRTKPGKHSSEAIITWPKAPGATGYAIQVNFTPQTPAGPWTALTSGTGRRRTVKGPTPGAQFLVQVASLGSGGTQAEWSDPILAVAAF